MRRGGLLLHRIRFRLEVGNGTVSLLLSGEFLRFFGRVHSQLLDLQSSPDRRLDGAPYQRLDDPCSPPERSPDQQHRRPLEAAPLSIRLHS